MHEFEIAFAAEIVNARRDAAIACRSGWPSAASDVIECSLMALHDEAATHGLRSAEVDTIAKRYLYWDANGNPQPRDFGSNVVPFSRV